MATASFISNTCPYPLTTEDLKIGIAVAAWNGHITGLLLDGAIASLKAKGFRDDQICILHVPGAFELPLGAQILFKRNCDAVISLGCVIRGETPHFEYVCRAATDGILKTGLDHQRPCIFGVLTTENEAQALERCGGNHGHKGKEAAETALWMLAAEQIHKK